MTNQSYMTLERKELQHQQILHNEEKQLANDCDDLLRDFMCCAHDDATAWDRFAEKVHRLKEVLRQQDESNKQVQEYRAMQLSDPESPVNTTEDASRGIDSP